MARRARFVLRGVPQHVIQRGNNRQAVFYTDVDRRFYLGYLGDAARKYGCLVHAYVLMTNHVHLLATPLETTALSRTMQHLGRRYVRYLNDRYRRSGTLWADRFKASLVDTELYFLQCCRYIELNPVRARIVSLLDECEWSSYRCHAFGIDDALVSMHDEYERLGRCPEERQVAYRALFASEQSATTDGVRLDCWYRWGQTRLLIGLLRLTNRV
jgi:putative transposase